MPILALFRLFCLIGIPLGPLLGWGQMIPRGDIQDLSVHGYSARASLSHRVITGMDTIAPPELTVLSCASSDSLRVYELTPTADEPDRWGFVAGPNHFGDLEIALQYELDVMPGSYLLEVWAVLAELGLGQNGTLQAHVYSLDPTGHPQQRIASSWPLTVEQLPDSGRSFFPLMTPISLNGQALALSLDFQALYETHDTLSLVSTRFGCALDTNSFLRLFDGQWVNIAVPGFAGGWDTALVPLIGYTQGTLATPIHTSPVHRQAIQIYSIHVQGDRLQLDLILPSGVPSQLLIRDMQGKTVFQDKLPPQGDPRQLVTIPVSAWASGYYSAQIMTSSSTTVATFSLP